MKTTHNPGINSFPISVDFFDKPEICAVTIEHGVKGQAAAIILLCAIYRNGYFIEWKPENYLPILKELPGINIKKMQRIVKTLVEWDFFDQEMFEQQQVLTNSEIQQHFMEVQDECFPDEDTLPYWLTDGNDDSNENNNNDNYSAQDDNHGAHEDKHDSLKNENVVYHPTPKHVRELIGNLFKDKPWVEEICVERKMNTTKLKELLDLFAQDCEKTGKDMYGTTYDMLNDFFNRIDTTSHYPFR